MGFKIVETELALRDLDSILAYIAVSLSNPTAATAFADAVEDCCSRLEKMPLMFELCRDPRLRAMGYHKAVIRSYVMVYKVDESTKTVYVLRFFYGRQDYEKLI